VEDLWAITRPGSPVVHGSTVVFPVSTTNLEENKSRTRLYRLSLEGGDPTPLTAEGVDATEPSFSPDGSRLAFVRKEEKKEGQLALLSLEGGEAEVLTDFPLGVNDPRWFPDGNRIAFVGWVLADAPTPEGTKKRLEEREKEPVKAHVTENRIFRFWDTWLTDGKVPHLFVHDMKTGKTRDLTPDSKRWFDFMEPSGSYDISPDGEEIVFSADASLPPHSPTNWDVFTVPTGGGAVTNLTAQNPADDLLPRYSPDGRWIVYGMQRENDFYADRVRLVAYDRKKKTHTVLTEGWDRSAMHWDFRPDSGEMVVTAEDEGRIALFRTEVAEKDPVRFARGGTYSGVVPLPDGGAVAVKTTISDPPELVRVAPDGSETRLTHCNDELMGRIDMGDVKEITYPGADGRPIQAYVVFPPGFDPSRKWPMLEMLHGGPHGITGDQFHFRWNMQLLASPGYVLFAPNFHGSTSWGQEFAACIQGAWGEKPFEDAMKGVDALLAEGYIDETRIAAIGASYGGYLVSWIAGHTDRFACIVNHAGVADTLAEYASDVSWGREKAMGGQPWEGLEDLDRMNPMRFAAGFTTPMLVVHGERDYRVPVTQGISMYNVLKAKGVPSRLVYFPDENHWVLKPRNSQFWHGEVFAWLARWLEGEPRPGA